MALFGDKERKKLESISASQRAVMIRRLERERRKINAEIETILAGYAKESGNKALRKKRFRIGRHSDDWFFMGEN